MGDYYQAAMSQGPLDTTVPSSEPATVALTNQKKPAESVADEVSCSQAASPPSFPDVEGPTLNSIASDSKLSTIAGLERRIESLETRLGATEQELGDVYGAVEQLLASQGKLEREVRQQRYGRYLVWGAVILILGILWMTLKTRLGTSLPQ